METIIAASRNQHKIDEMKAILRKFDMDILSRDEAGLPTTEVEEDGDTFEANSLIKAQAILDLCGKITIADDSGLEVEYLHGEPGVYSARYAGEDASDRKNNEKLLAMLDGVTYSDRRARFVSVITLLFPDGRKLVARGECYGHILTSPEGNNGFGYDPLFVPDGHQRTFAQLTAEEKNQISHRAKALIHLEALLREEQPHG